MDPITAALTLATEITKVYVLLLEGATAAQKQTLVEDWIATNKFWRDLFAGVSLKG